MPTPLSVIILTYNEAERPSGQEAGRPVSDEILIVDSGSTDGTVALAKQLDTNVFESHEKLG